jgi:uncharacterized delta-60 repeat protein
LTLTLLASTPADAFAADGALDPSFGAGGKVITDFSGALDEVRALAIQSDGKIVVAGRTGSQSNSAFALARYKSDGSLDDSFGSGGRLTTSFSAFSAFAYAVSIRADGRIVVAGSALVGGASQFALAQYNTDGSLDTSFGVGGKTTTNFADAANPLANAGVSAIAIQPDGKIIAAGYVVVSTRYRFAVARYTSNGSLDGAFGSGGKVTSSGTNRYEAANSIALQPDGKIVVGGAIGNGFTSDSFALVRYNSDGSTDATFGAQGAVTTKAFDFPDSLGVDFASVTALIIQPDGKIVAAGGVGYFLDSNSFALARYNTDGSLDPTFGALGKVSTLIGSNYDDWSYAAAIQLDGKIIVAGYSYGGGAGDFAMVRYNPNGSLDPAFGTGGVVTTDFSGRSDLAYAMAIQADGKIVAAGSTYNSARTAGSFALARYTGAPPSPAVELKLDPASVRLGGSFRATFFGGSLTSDTYFDLRFRSPLSTVDQVALNWQRGLSATHGVPTATPPGIWLISGIRPHLDINDHNALFSAVSTSLSVSPLVVTDLNLDTTKVPLGGSYVITVSGISLNNDTYFDLRFRGPDGADQIAMNWQRGVSAVHNVPPGTSLGPWTITGIWAHQDANDHSTDFVPVSATITVTPF